MYSMPIALILADRLSRDARSALPNAPVVAHVDKVSMLPRTRKAVAGGLHYVADVVAPKRPVRPTPVRAGLRREAG